MSRARFARRQVSGEWYELSSQGSSIGVPTEFDFYMEVEGKSPVEITEAKKKELVGICCKCAERSSAFVFEY